MHKQVLQIQHKFVKNPSWLRLFIKSVGEELKLGIYRVANLFGDQGGN